MVEFEHDGDGLVTHGVFPQNYVQLIGVGAVGVGEVHLHAFARAGQGTGCTLPMAGQP